MSGGVGRGLVGLSGGVRGRSFPVMVMWTVLGVGSIDVVFRGVLLIDGEVCEVVGGEDVFVGFVFCLLGVAGAYVVRQLVLVFGVMVGRGEVWQVPGVLGLCEVPGMIGLCD
jgi:hypothetical protein